MRPAGFGVAPRQDLIGGVEKENLGPEPAMFELGKYLGPVRKEDAFAGVDSKRDAGQIAIVFGGERNDVGGQRDRQVIDAIEA